MDSSILEYIFIIRINYKQSSHFSTFRFLFRRSRARNLLRNQWRQQPEEAEAAYLKGFTECLCAATLFMSPSSSLALSLVNGSVFFLLYIYTYSCIFHMCISIICVILVCLRLDLIHVMQIFIRCVRV